MGRVRPNVPGIMGEFPDVARMRPEELLHWVDGARIVFAESRSAHRRKVLSGIELDVLITARMQHDRWGCCDHNEIAILHGISPGESQLIVDRLRTRGLLPKPIAARRRLSKPVRQVGDDPVLEAEFEAMRQTVARNLAKRHPGMAGRIEDATRYGARRAVMQFDPGRARKGPASNYANRVIYNEAVRRLNRVSASKATAPARPSPRRFTAASLKLAGRVIAARESGVLSKDAHAFAVLLHRLHGFNPGEVAAIAGTTRQNIAALFKAQLARKTGLITR